jgi:hypothetical protein
MTHFVSLLLILLFVCSGGVAWDIWWSSFYDLHPWVTNQGWIYNKVTHLLIFFMPWIVVLGLAQWIAGRYARRTSRESFRKWLAASDEG